MQSRSMRKTRRDFIRDLSLSAAAMPFVWNLPSLGYANTEVQKKRVVLVFSPNGVVPDNFWPTEEGEDFTLPEILTPLEPFQRSTPDTAWSLQQSARRR